MALFSKKPSPDNLPGRRRAELDSRSKTEPTLAQESAIFRMGRTLTGSASSRVRGSADESQGHLKSARVQAHHLANQRRKIGLGLVIVLASALIIFLLLLQFTANVRVAISGSTTATPLNDTYAKEIQAYFAYRPFERLRFATNLQALTQSVQQQHSEVASIKMVGGVDFVTTEYRVELRKALVGWNISGKQYYVDASGVSFTENVTAQPAVQIIDQSGVPVQAGTAIASNRFLSYVGRTVALLADRQISVEQVIIPVGTTRQIDLRIGGRGYLSKLSIDRPAAEQVEDLARTLAYVDQKGIAPQYLDVRVSGKAFYK